ncbi:MAG TPA: porin family protein [Bacteroidales bacterium]|nr:porin family protein [Bacteroidales bacterium]
MKKILLTIVFASILVFGFSQRFNGGAMIGLIAGQVAGDTYSGYSKVGPAAGFFVNFQPADHSSIQLELAYMQKGSRKSANTVKEDYDSYLLRLNYIEMPLLYRYHIRWFALEAGPSLGFFMSGYEEYNGEDVKADDFASVTFQLNFGVVFTVAENWKFGIRTNNSLTNLRNQTYTGHVSRFWTHGQFSDLILFSVGYQFLHF